MPDRSGGRASGSSAIAPLADGRAFLAPLHPISPRLRIDAEHAADRTRRCADSTADDTADRPGSPIAIFDSAFRTPHGALCLG